MSSCNENTQRNASPYASHSAHNRLQPRDKLDITLRLSFPAIATKSSLVRAVSAMEALKGIPSVTLVELDVYQQPRCKQHKISSTRSQRRSRHPL